MVENISEGKTESGCGGVNSGNVDKGWSRVIVVVEVGIFLLDNDFLNLDWHHFYNHYDYYYQ